MAALAALLLVAGSARADERIVGGRDATITEVPYQVAVVFADASDRDGLYCGGSILDAQHVATAAHCVTYEGQLLPPDIFDVVAGTSVRSDGDTPYEAGRQRVGVVGTKIAPGYLDGTGPDAAVLALKEPLDLTSPTARAIQLGDATRLVPPAQARISGWGDVNQHDFSGDGVPQSMPDRLQLNDVDVNADARCAADYPGAFDPATQMCAGGPGEDTCQGDSGGPLAVGIGSAAVLEGITSTGVGCGSSLEFPGIYTEVADPRVRALLQQQPASISGPALTGTVAIGETVTCAGERWSGGPDAVQVTFERHRGDGTAEIARGASTSRTYAVTATDVGSRLDCVVDASNPRGSGRASSAQSTTVPAPPAPPAAPAPAAGGSTVTSTAPVTIPADPPGAGTAAPVTTATTAQLPPVTPASSTASGPPAPMSAAPVAAAPASRVSFRTSGAVDRAGRFVVRLAGSGAVLVRVQVGSRTLAHAAVSLTAGKVRSVRLRLDRGARRVLRHRKLRATLVVASDAGTTRRAVVLACG